MGLAVVKIGHVQARHLWIDKGYPGPASLAAEIVKLGYLPVSVKVIDEWKRRHHWNDIRDRDIAKSQAVVSRAGPTDQVHKAMGEMASALTIGASKILSAVEQLDVMALTSDPALMIRFMDSLTKGMQALATTNAQLVTAHATMLSVAKVDPNHERLPDAAKPVLDMDAIRVKMRG